MLRASGPYGELRVSYQHAARLGPWTIEPTDGVGAAFVFRSTITEEDRHWMRQKPLDIILPVGNVEWIWRDVELTRDGVAVSMPVAERPIVEARRTAAVPVPAENRRRT